MSLFGEHPKQLVERDRPTDITLFISPSAAPLHLMPPRGESSFHNKELWNVTFGDMLQGSSTIVPKDEFQILAWQSRIPAFTKFIATCIVGKYWCAFSQTTKSGNGRHVSNDIVMLESYHSSVANVSILNIKQNFGGLCHLYNP